MLKTASLLRCWWGIPLVLDFVETTLLSSLFLDELKILLLVFFFKSPEWAEHFEGQLAFF